MVRQNIEASPLRYKLILKEQKANTLEMIAHFNEIRASILRAIETLQNYEGNAAVKVHTFAREDGQITAAYIDQFQQETIQEILRLEKKSLILERVLDEWHEELENDQSSLEQALLRTVKIIGATCIGTNTNRNFKDVEYDVAIVDEAGQITMHDLLVPLTKAKKIILIGDHLQLPPGGEADFCKYLQENNLLAFSTLDDEEEMKEYADELDRVFSISLFEKLFRDPAFDSHKVMLDTQFRMHPDIAQFISDNFYEGKYKSGVTGEARSLKIAGFEKPIYFVDTIHSPEKYEDECEDKKVHVNSYEASICASYLTKIILAIENNDYEKKKKDLKDSDGNYDIGVITAYKKQIGYIREELRRRLLAYFEEERVENILAHLAINTLDSFQGRDNQIIFYSFVRSNKKKEIGFLNEVRRLNVMMTRAKSLLLMIGDSETLRKNRSLTIHDKKKAADYYGALVDYCKEKDGYIDYAYEVIDK